MPGIRFVILATPGLTTDLLCLQLSRQGVVEAIILEEKESSWTKIKRRLRKLPFYRVIGQLFFLAILSPILSRLAKKRIHEIVAVSGFDDEVKQPAHKYQVKTINDRQVIDLINQHKPDIVFLNGTRIVHKKILERIRVPVVNIHVGITPKYRGIHGGYWALYNNDETNFGVTLHRVDAGVDTGTVISQQHLHPEKEDSFASYPVLQFVAGLKLVEQYFTTGKTIPPQAIPAESKQYYHPGFFQYLFNRWFRGIR